MPKSTNNSISKNDLSHVFNFVGSRWELLNNHSIFISGATGIIGKWLLATLNHACLELGMNTEIIALSRNPNEFISNFPTLADRSNIRWITGDVRTFNLNDFNSIKWAIHAATDVVAYTPPEEVLITCASGTENVIRQLANRDCKRILFISSGAIYGKIPESMYSIPENFIGGVSTISPESAYAEGKRYSELLCTLLGKRYGIEIPIARCFAMVGPYLPLNKHFAIGNFIDSVLQNNPIVINGDGTPMRSYLYIADVISLIWMLLFSGRSTCYNVGSDQAISIIELANKVKLLTGSDVPVIIGNENIHGSHANRYIPSIELIKNEFSLNHFIQIDDSILNTNLS
jgi:dTDP-glucose 4,6-dehydratase